MTISAEILLRLERVLGDYLRDSNPERSDLKKFSFSLFTDKGYKSVFLAKDNISVLQLNPKITIFSFLKRATQVNIGAKGVPKYFIHLWELETEMQFAISNEMPNASAREAMQRWYVDMTNISNHMGGVLPIYIKDYGAWGGIITTYV
ncbi:hypothetical protein GO003_024780 [Methylicorpusculum oleiharenae]|uniref:hypothetical protein n=1 Tax=Methylicorpusculum oleiharenae TaxID=1338687 RepID=UPI00135BBFC4|nr:hypothetical protein [Methylicorpusculum oleiharenae]MCD2453597.1 hypothetical protein [Methylicorpusculum oleiharenae]